MPCNLLTHRCEGTPRGGVGDACGTALDCELRRCDQGVCRKVLAGASCSIDDDARAVRGYAAGR